jgi:hypothetical protein
MWASRTAAGRQSRNESVHIVEDPAVYAMELGAARDALERSGEPVQALAHPVMRRTERSHR